MTLTLQFAGSTGVSSSPTLPGYEICCGKSWCSTTHCQLCRQCRSCTTQESGQGLHHRTEQFSPVHSPGTDRGRHRHPLPWARWQRCRGRCWSPPLWRYYTDHRSHSLIVQIVVTLLFWETVDKLCSSKSKAKARARAVLVFALSAPCGQI